MDIIRDYESHIDWWVSEPDNGQSDALRKGFARATGDLIAWLNSDDVYFPNALHHIGEAFSVDPGASIYVGGIAVGAHNDGPIEKCVIPSAPRTWLPQYGMMGIGQQSSFYSREVYEAAGEIDVDMFIRMDADLWYRLMQIRPKASVINAMVGFIRWHGATKSSNGVERYLQEKRQFIKSLGLHPIQYFLYDLYFDLRRLSSLGYIYSWRHTRALRGMRMSDVWHMQTEKQVKPHPT